MILWLLLTQLSTPLNLNGQAITRAACDGGVVCTKSGQTLTIIGTGSGGGGGGGSVNTASGSASFDGGSLDAYTTVTAAWASGASVIVCKPTGEEASVEGLQTTVISQASGSFVVRAEPRNGTHWGALPFVCIGN